MTAESIKAFVTFSLGFCLIHTSTFRMACQASWFIWKCRAQALTAAMATITSKAKVPMAMPAEEAPLVVVVVSTQHPTRMLCNDHTFWACST